MARVTHVKDYRRKKQGQSFARQFLKGAVRLILLIVLFVAVYYFTRLAFFTITEVQIEGGETISHETLREMVEAELDGTYFRLVPKRFAYLYPHDRLVYVLERTPRVHGVQVERMGRSALFVTFEEYAPHALWCQHESTSSPCYFLDETGYAFAEAPMLQGGALLRHYALLDGTSLPAQVIDENILVAIDTFVAQAETALGFRINALTYMQDNDVTFWINGGGSIQASLKRDLTDTLENIAATLESETFEHIEPGNFNYIDARFENKIFINEEVVEEIATTTDETVELSE